MIRPRANLERRWHGRSHHPHGPLEDFVLSAALSPDGKRIVTASIDKTARVWNARLRQCRRQAHRHCVSGWSVLQQALRDATTDCLSPDQRQTYLTETDADADAAYEACERSHGRTPLPRRRQEAPGPPCGPQSRKPPSRLIVELARTSGQETQGTPTPSASSRRPPTSASRTAPTPGAGLPVGRRPPRRSRRPPARAPRSRRPPAPPASVSARSLGEAGWEAREGARSSRRRRTGAAIHVTPPLRGGRAARAPLQEAFDAPCRTGQHLAELPGCLVRYEWPGTETAKPVPDPPARRRAHPLRPGPPRVARCRHEEHPPGAAPRVRAGPPCTPSTRAATSFPHASLASLRRALAAPGAPVAVLHVLCHGARPPRVGDRGVRPGLERLRGRRRRPRDGSARSRAAQAARTVCPARSAWSCSRRATARAPASRATRSAGWRRRCIASAFRRSWHRASRFRSRGRSAVARRCSTDRLLVGLASLESAFLAAREKVAEDTATQRRLGLAPALCPRDGWAGSPAHRGLPPPYRGLLAFHGEHARWFFGREREVGEAVGALAALVEAKKAAVLGGDRRVGDGQVIAGLRRGGARAGEAGRRAVEGREPAATGRFESGLRWQGRGRGRGEGEAAAPRGGSVRGEQLHRRRRSSGDARGIRWLRRLWALAGEEGSGVSVIVTLRVDYLGRCGEIALDENGLTLEDLALAKEHEAHRMFVLRMKAEALRGDRHSRARPSRWWGSGGTDGRPRGADRRRCTRTQATGAPARAGTCRSSNTRLTRCGRCGRATASATGLRRTPTPASTASRARWRRSAERAPYARCATEVRRRAARRLLVQLVDTRGEAMLDTRRRLRRDKLRRGPSGEAAVFDEVLDALARERLVVVSEEGVVEIAHEELVRQWGTLREWMTDERTQREALAPLRTWVEAGERADGRPARAGAGAHGGISG